MAEGGSEARRLRRAVLALSLSACAAPLAAQTPTKQPPLPPPPDTTTVVEKPDDQRRRPTADSPPSPAPETKAPEHVPQDASGFHLSTLETKNLTLLYHRPDPDLPDALHRAARSRTRSPSTRRTCTGSRGSRSTILLKDFSDYGNAAALGSPSDMVLLDVAPLSLVDGDLLARRALLHAR